MIRIMISLALFLAQTSIGRADDVEASVAELVKNMKELTKELKPVKDKKTAEVALPKINVVGEKLQKNWKSIVSSDLTKEQKSVMEARIKKELDDANVAYDAEMSRLEKQLEIVQFLRKESPWVKMQGDAKAEKSKVDISALERAAKIDYLKNQAWAGKLKLLAVYLERGEDALVDPWGQTFQYDPKGPKNNGAKPDIWTETPWKVKIGNWEEEK